MVLGLFRSILTNRVRNLNEIELHSKILKLSLGASLDLAVIPRAAGVEDDISFNEFVKVDTHLAVVLKFKSGHHLSGVVNTMIKMHTAFHRSLVRIITIAKKLARLTCVLYVFLLGGVPLPGRVLMLRVNVGVLLGKSGVGKALEHHLRGIDRSPSRGDCLLALSQRSGDGEVSNLAVVFLVRIEIEGMIRAGLFLSHYLFTLHSDADMHDAVLHIKESCCRLGSGRIGRIVRHGSNSCLHEIRILRHCPEIPLCVIRHNRV